MRNQNKITITLYVDKDGNILDQMHYEEKDKTHYTSGLKHYEALKQAVLNPVYKSVETGEFICFMSKK